MRHYLHLLTLLLLLPALCSAADTTNFEQRLMQQDLSHSFTREGLIGAMGGNLYRLDVRFDEITRLNDSTYQVAGLTRAAMQLVMPFEGEIRVQKINQGEDNTAFIYGTFKVAEYYQGELMGRFDGYFRQKIGWDGEHTPTALPYVAGSPFARARHWGVWRSELGAESRYDWTSGEEWWGVPDDFATMGVGMGDWLVGEAYRHSGWESHYALYSGTSSPKEQQHALEEEQNWEITPAWNPGEMPSKQLQRQLERHPEVMKIVDAVQLDEEGNPFYEYVPDTPMYIHFVVENYTPGAICVAIMEREKNENLDKRRQFIAARVMKGGVGTARIILYSKEGAKEAK